MKQRPYKQIGVLFLVLIFCATNALAAKSVEKRRKIEKEFNVNADALVEIDNRYGKVHINTWDKDVVQLTIEILVEDKSEERALERLEKIEIEIFADASKVSAITNIENMKSGGWFWENWTGDNGNHKMEIDYTLNIPKTNSIDIRQMYGNVYVGDLLGNADIVVKYGNLDAEKLAGTKSNIELKYGNGKIELMEEAEVEVKYSNLEIDVVRDLEMESGYSDVELGQVGILDTETKYGDLEIERVHTMDGDVKYTDLDIEELISELELEISYGGTTHIDYIDPNFNNIDIEASYINIDLNFDEDTSFEIDAESSYGNINWSGTFNFANKDEDNEGTSKSVNARVRGKGKIQGSVDVDVSYGNLKIRK